MLEAGKYCILVITYLGLSSAIETSLDWSDGQDGSVADLESPDFKRDEFHMNGKRRCRPGLPCGEENINDLQLHMNDKRRRCRPGLPCAEEDMNKLEFDMNDKRGRCRPGLPCGEQDMIGSQDKNIYKHIFSSLNNLKSLPPPQHQSRNTKSNMANRWISPPVSNKNKEMEKELAMLSARADVTNNNRWIPPPLGIQEIKREQNVNNRWIPPPLGIQEIKREQNVNNRWIPPPLGIHKIKREQNGHIRWIPPAEGNSMETKEQDDNTKNMMRELYENRWIPPPLRQDQEEESVGLENEMWKRYLWNGEDLFERGNSICWNNKEEEIRCRQQNPTHPIGCRECEEKPKKTPK